MAEQVKRMYSEVKILRNAVAQRQERCDDLEQLAKEMAEGIEREQRIIPSVHFERLLSRFREVCGGEK